MTQTLRRERRQKFFDILNELDIIFPAEIIRTGEQTKYIMSVAERLADAATSQSERATDEDQGEYNTELFRGDWREYPERIHKIAETLRDVWKFTLPPKPAKGEGKGQYAFYIQSMDAIKQSCAEFGADVLVKVHADWKAGFKNGLAPYTVAQPTSLVNMCAAKARELRDSKPESQPEPKQFPKMINGRLV